MCWNILHNPAHSVDTLSISPILEHSHCLYKGRPKNQQTVVFSLPTTMSPPKGFVSISFFTSSEMYIIINDISIWEKEPDDLEKKLVEKYQLYCG